MKEGDLIRVGKEEKDSKIGLLVEIDNMNFKKPDVRFQRFFVLTEDCLLQWWACKYVYKVL